MSQAKLEKKMQEYFVDKAPFQIPSNGRKSLVEWLPWISVIVGIISLLAAIGLWHAGHITNAGVDFVNNISRSYGDGTVINSANLGLLYFLGLIVLIVQGLLMLVAYPGLKAKSKKRGWDILLLSTILSLFYGIFIAFTDYGGIGRFIGSIISCIIGLYLLSQVRGYYKK